VFSYVERGFYAPQLRRLLNLFDRRQLFVFRTDRLWERPHQVLSSVEEFLGVSSRIQPEKRYVAPMDNSDIGAFPDECRAQLNAIYEQDIRTTAHITGIDLSDWLDPHYRELMVAT
jgi:hypothetical protein